MIFLNISYNKPSKIHSEDLLTDANQLIEKLVQDFKAHKGNLVDFSSAFIAPLFDLYIKYNQEVFSAVSKALALDYSQNFEDLERDSHQSYRSRLILHCLIWQDSQAGVQELVSNGKAGLENYNGEANYRAFKNNAYVKNEALQPVLAMVESYLLADIYAFLPILDQERLIELSADDWHTLMEEYSEALDVFRNYALEAQILNKSKYPQAIAI